MFARRTGWDFSRNRVTRLLDRKKASGIPILDLTESNPTRCNLIHAESVLAALAHPDNLAYDPDPRGDRNARAALSTIYGSRAVAIQPEQLILTASTSEAYAFLFRLLADPGDRVLVPVPSYPLFDHLARISDVTLTPYALDTDLSFAPDLDTVDRLASDGARAIIVVNPGNPTGRFLRNAELEELLDVCRRRRLALICDEVFGDYVLAPPPDRARTAAGRQEALTFCLDGLSKMLALPQLKLGWIAVSGPEAEEALRRLEVIADAYLSVNTPVQKALPELLSRRRAIQRAILERLRRNRDLLLRKASPNGACRSLPVEGGWYAILELPRIKSDEQWCLEILEEDHVLVHPGYFFEIPGERHLVVSLLPEPDLFREGIERLVARVDRVVRA